MCYTAIMELTYILSQIFIVIAYSLFGLSYFAENRKMIFICNSCSLVAEATAYILLFAWGGLAMTIIAATRNIVFLIQAKLLQKQPHLKKFEWASLVLILLLSIVGTVITWQGILGTFAIVACAIYTYSIWQKNDKVYDILGIFASVFLLIYNIFIGSLFGVIMEGILMIWIIIASITGLSLKDLKSKKINKNTIKHIKNK